MEWSKRMGNKYNGILFGKCVERKCRASVFGNSMFQKKSDYFPRSIPCNLFPYDDKIRISPGQLPGALYCIVIGHGDLSQSLFLCASVHFCR